MRRVVRLGVVSAQRLQVRRNIYCLLDYGRGVFGMR